MSGLSRRGFIGASGAAGLAFAASVHAKARGEGDKIRLGIIGTGARGQQHLREGLWGSKDFQIVAVADVDEPHLSDGLKLAWLSNAGERVTFGDRPTPEQMLKLKTVTKPKAYRTHGELLAAEGLDAVVIATPPHTHASILTACLDAGKHVFCETPMATSIADGRDIVAKAHETGLVVQIGHQRRYHPNYNLAASPRYRKNKLRRLVQATLCDHSNHSGRVRSDVSPRLPTDPDFSQREQQERMLNWRLYAMPDGGPCLYALPALIDTANWFCGTVPSRVFASGGTNFWLDGRDTPDNLIAIFEYNIRRKSAGFDAVDARSDDQDLRALLQSYTVRCSYSYRLTNSEAGLREHIQGDGATLMLSMSDPCLCKRESWVNPELDYTPEEREQIWARYKTMLGGMSEAEKRSYEVTRGQTAPPPPEFDRLASQNRSITAIGSEESAEVHQFRAFAEHIRSGGTPRANVMVGLAAVIAGESARRSFESGQPVDIDPALMAFDFETPSISEYDTNAAPIPETTESM